MNYVIGFLGNDGYLGRTFHCSTVDEADMAMSVIFGGNGDTDKPLDGYWLESSTWNTECGTYFMGGLESVEDETR